MKRTTEDRQEGDDVAGDIFQAIRTFVSKTSCGYLIAQNSKIGERRVEMHSSSDALSRPSLPQRPDSAHSIPNSSIGLSQHISSYEPDHTPLNLRNQVNAPNGSFPIKERSDLGPQSFKSLRSTHIAASANIKKLQPKLAIQLKQTEEKIPILPTTLSINHPSITIRANLQSHTPTFDPFITHPHPKQPKIPSSTLQHRRAILSSEPTKPEPFFQPHTTRHGKHQQGGFVKSHYPPIKKTSPTSIPSFP